VIAGPEREMSSLWIEFIHNSRLSDGAHSIIFPKLYVIFQVPARETGISSRTDTNPPLPNVEINAPATAGVI
jgi:hypothetical protein